jgi:hypothetical protein
MVQVGHSRVRSAFGAVKKVNWKLSPPIIKGVAIAAQHHGEMSVAQFLTTLFAPWAPKDEADGEAVVAAPVAVAAPTVDDIKRVCASLEDENRQLQKSMSELRKQIAEITPSKPRKKRPMLAAPPFKLDSEACVSDADAPAIAENAPPPPAMPN